jgi:hypothetical protein
MRRHPPTYGGGAVHREPKGVRVRAHEGYAARLAGVQHGKGGKLQGQRGRGRGGVRVGDGAPHAGSTAWSTCVLRSRPARPEPCPAWNAHNVQV